MRKIPNSYTKTYSFHLGKLREEKTTEKTNQRDRSARPSEVLGVAGIPVKSADFLHFEFPNSSFSPSRFAILSQTKTNKIQLNQETKNFLRVKKKKALTSHVQHTSSGSGLWLVVGWVACLDGEKVGRKIRGVREL